ncbi:helix-turn-helix domain-containing protein [Leptospira weilii]|uniref:helix-turn-helix domain-containing protein n=1 Tax=Leptospira weilii TaxID=28184 RepID=UPI00077388F2|nr:AraC family transcriptional regulator [Leptospira weilii]
MNTAEIFNYKSFLQLGILYFHAFGVGIGLILGFLKLFSGDNFKKSYGTVLYSTVLFLILNNGILIDQGTLRNESRILFGFYYSLVLYSSLAVLICFKYVLESLDNPWIYCKRLLGTIPITILLSFLIPDLYFISFVDIIGFVISIFTFIWSLSRVLNTNKSILHYNLPFLSFLISICFVFDFFGSVFFKKECLFFAEFIPGSVICYAFILERFFPSLFGKVKVSGANLYKETQSETISIPEVKETKKYKYPPRDLLEGTDLEKVKIKLNQFITSKGFKDEELRLPDFAADLGLSTHQASRYLNKYLNKNYNDFLNFHRMNEVMIMIRAQSNFNLLSIALECGFNSPSSFHRACIKFTGKSPRELRKHIRLNPNKDVDA